MSKRARMQRSGHGFAGQVALAAALVAGHAVAMAQVEFPTFGPIRVMNTTAAVDAGDDSWQSLRDEGFVSHAEAEAMAAASRAGHLAYALDALAGSMDRVRQHRTLWWIEVCKPLVVIAMGFLVAGFCLAMFLPLITLIEKTTVTP